jgi:hypothetical protein
MTLSWRKLISWRLTIIKLIQNLTYEKKLSFFRNNPDFLENTWLNQSQPTIAITWNAIAKALKPVNLVWIRLFAQKTTVFERNDSLEIETYDGKTDTASIRWVNDCEYILKNYIKKTWQRKSQ